MYEMRYEQPRVGKNDLEVCIIGAGFSGIAMAVRLKELGIKFRIIEKSERLGGTWWDNQYPGCACDIPSHLYRYFFLSLSLPEERNLVFLLCLDFRHYE